jgi:hypothetical protein
LKKIETNFALLKKYQLFISVAFPAQPSHLLTFAPLPPFPSVKGNPKELKRIKELKRKVKEPKSPIS